MKVVRHGKPAKAFTERLRSPVDADFDAMVQACVDAIVRGSTDVLALFPYTLKFPKGFPKGILEVKYEDGTNVHRIKAKKLLKWLNEAGYTDITMDMLRGEQIAFGINTTKLEEMFDSVEELGYNNEIGE